MKQRPMRRIILFHAFLFFQSNFNWYNCELTCLFVCLFWDWFFIVGCEFRVNDNHWFFICECDNLNVSQASFVVCYISRYMSNFLQIQKMLKIEYQLLQNCLYFFILQIVQQINFYNLNSLERKISAVCYLVFEMDDCLPSMMSIQL